MPIILPFPPFSVLGLSQTRHFKKLLITEPSARSTMDTFGSHVITSLTHHRATNDMVHVPRHATTLIEMKVQLTGGRMEQNWGYSHSIADSSCTDTKTLPERASVYASKRWFRRDFFNGAKLRHATPVFESGSSHIEKVYPTLSRNVNWYSDRSVSKWVGARTGIDWDESEHLEKRTGI